MIKKVRLQNFKSHASTELETGNLTLLCGQNGVGKSSVFQALLLLRQSHQKSRLNDVLDLNRPLCEIGTAFDALYQFGDDTIQFTLEGDKGRAHWEFKYEENKRNATFLKVEK
ncbi:MAG: AAA family ATPase, partial [Saprospiraceae bacterium]|nr:AAA family ATPase [Saprospiraceae bacterium]